MALPSAPAARKEHEIRQELQPLVERIDRSNTLFFFDIDGHKVLFRIDGMIVTVSDVIFDLLSTYRGMPVRLRFSLLARERGEEELDAALRSLAAFDAVSLRRRSPSTGHPTSSAPNPAGSF